MSTNGLCAAILAAGLSTRMRPLLQGRSKALCLLEGKTLLEHCCNLFHASAVGRVYVITGHDHEAVENEAVQLGVTAVYNQYYEDGMFSSVTAAVKAALQDERNEGMFVLPVDIPLVSAETVRSLAAHWSGFTCRTDIIFVPMTENCPGHPPLIGQGHWRNILAYEGSGGLRGYIEEAAVKGTPAVQVLQVHQREMLWDIDSPADLSKFALHMRCGADSGTQGINDMGISTDRTTENETEHEPLPEK